VVNPRKKYRSTGSGGTGLTRWRGQEEMTGRNGQDGKNTVGGNTTKHEYPRLRRSTVQCTLSKTCRT
jgi:hypothetical protein